MSPIETANCMTTSAARSRPEPGVSAAERFAFKTCAGWNRDRKKAGIEAADDPHHKVRRDGGQEDSVAPEIAKREVGIEESGERAHQELHQRQRKQHRDRRNQDGFGDELDDELLSRRAQHLAQRDFARPLAGTGGCKVGEVHDRHPKDQHCDDREGRDRPPVVARGHRPALGLAEMDVAAD